MMVDVEEEEEEEEEDDDWECVSHNSFESFGLISGV